MLEYNIDLKGKTILVTGAAGFIGSNLVKRLLTDFDNIKVIGIDSITDYYDVNLKYERLTEIDSLSKDWTFLKGSIADKALIENVFTENKIDVVVNLAAQAGVRYSITNPAAISRATSSVSTTYWKSAVTMRKHIWSMPAVPLSMVATRRYPIPPMIRWTILSASMPPPRKVTN